MLTILAFALALGVLIAVHEYGHYRMAVACGVKVLRFSIGFGRPLLRWTSRHGTEFVLAALPLGGYVRMLDEREAPVPIAQRHRAFNTQPLRSRALIVAAGPLANLLLAMVLYATVSWLGESQPRAILASPVAGTMAEQAGLRGGEWVLQTAIDGDDLEPVASFDELRWRLSQAALEQQDMRLWVAAGPDAPGHEVRLPLSTLAVEDTDTLLFRKVGIVAPWSAAVVGDVMPGGAAQAAGLRAGDRVLQVNDKPVGDAEQLRAWIRESLGPDGRGREMRWRLERHGQQLDVNIVPRPEWINGQRVGRVGAYIGAMPAMVEVSHGFWGGWAQGWRRTVEVSGLTLRTMGRMVLGTVSLKNLSGPLTIAEYAGKSASMGIEAYLQFLALISVSLGVLNLLPLPVLDGGHLLYYLWEGTTGRPISEAWMERLQRGGVVLLALLMALAVFNDIARLLG